MSQIPVLSLSPFSPNLRTITIISPNIRKKTTIFSERRKMGGGHGHGVTYKGVTMHQPKRWHTVTGKGLCAVMWFWVLYRAKKDGPVVLGWRHPWEGHEDHH